MMFSSLLINTKQPEQKQNQPQQYIAKAEMEVIKEEPKVETKTESAKAPIPAKPKVTQTYPDGVCIEAMKQYFPESDWQIAYAIMRAESGARPDAVGGPNRNGTYDYGCFQINNEPATLDPYINARRAFEKSRTSTGWRHWTVYKTGKYLSYL